jgi:hypothetical protein
MSVAAGSGLGTTSKYLRRTTSGAAGQDLGTATSGTAGNGLYTTTNYL